MLRFGAGAESIGRHYQAGYQVRLPALVTTTHGQLNETDDMV
ncbi:Uncharacterized protein PPKH_0738 [Pseudomonas putida]|nr:Uncharacterized protein PPKH_0738 [Pseudomonas putida]